MTWGRVLCCFPLSPIIHFSNLASQLALQRTLSPAVIFRGVDGAVGKVRPSTYLRQTLSVEQGPRATMVCWKLQADTDNTVKERKEKDTVSLPGIDMNVDISTRRNHHNCYS